MSDGILDEQEVTVYVVEIDYSGPVAVFSTMDAAVTHARENGYDAVERYLVDRPSDTYGDVVWSR